MDTRPVFSTPLLIPFRGVVGEYECSDYIHDRPNADHWTRDGRKLSIQPAFWFDERREITLSRDDGGITVTEDGIDDVSEEFAHFGYSVLTDTEPVGARTTAGSLVSLD